MLATRALAFAAFVVIAIVLWCSHRWSYFFLEGGVCRSFYLEVCSLCVWLPDESRVKRGIRF